jgi:APA family basic amino acid/polyamine antiporter
LFISLADVAGDRRFERFGQWQWIVVIGSTLATLGVLVSLMAGVSRMLFAMASDRRLPAYLARVHPKHRVPHLAELTGGLVLVAIVLLVDVRSAIAFSSCTVLLYYTITNLSAFTMKPDERLFSTTLALFGLVGCLVLSFTLPIASVVGGVVVMVIVLAIFFLQTRFQRSPSLSWP